MKQTTTSTFDADILKSEVPVLIDFWADWCGPCLAMATVLDEVAEERAGQLDFLKVDVDQNQELVARFQVRGIPTLLLFKNGELVATKVGAVKKPELLAFLELFL